MQLCSNFPPFELYLLLKVDQITLKYIYSCSHLTTETFYKDLERACQKVLIIGNGESRCFLLTVARHCNKSQNSRWHEQLNTAKLLYSYEKNLLKIAYHLTSISSILNQSSDTWRCTCD